MAKSVIGKLCSLHRVSAVETCLRCEIGELGRQLHVADSRNEELSRLLKATRASLDDPGKAQRDLDLAKSMYDDEKRGLLAAFSEQAREMRILKRIIERLLDFSE